MNNFNQRIQNFIFLSIFFIFSINVVRAQEIPGKIMGSITTSDGEKAFGVNIILKNSRYATVSNESGTFEFNKVKSGNYILQISLSGYETLEQALLVTDNKTTLIDLQLRVSNKELQEVIITSNKKKLSSKESNFIARMPLKNLENPQVYSVINSKIIEQQVITNFDDALKSAAGVVSGGSEPGVRSYSYLRGFDEQAFFRNGKMIGNWTENDMANIENIEVIKGPSGTLFGGHGRANYGGVVNRITKKPYNKFGGNLSLISGNNAYNRLTADINIPLSKDSTLLARINTAYRSETSFQDYGRAESFFIAPSFIYKASERLKFVVEADIFKITGTQRASLSASGITNTDQLSSIYKSSFTTNEIQYEKKSTIFSVDAIYKISDNWTSTTSYAYSYSLYAPEYTTVAINFDTQIVDRTVAYSHYDYNFTNIQQYFNGDFKIGKFRNRLIAGVDYLGERGLWSGADVKFDSFNYNQVAPYLSKQKFDSSLANEKPWKGVDMEDRFSIYASNVLDLAPRVHVMTSLRYEYLNTETPSATVLNSNDPENTYHQGAWTPKLGLVYEVIASQLSLFGNYMGGTKNINKYLKDDGKGNAFLQKASPEKATQWELGVKSNLFNDKLTLMASYFDIKVDNRLRTDPNNQLYEVQDGTQANKGYEIELFANPVTGLDIMLGYANLKAKYLNGTEAGNHVAYTPKTTVNYWVSYTFKEGDIRGFGAGFGGNYKDKSFLTSSNLVLISSVRTMNATLFYEQSRYRVAIKADNLSNEIYWGDNLNAQTPRSIKAALTFKF